MLLLRCLAAHYFSINASGGFGAVGLVDFRVSESFINSGDLPSEPRGCGAGSRTRSFASPFEFNLK